MTAALIALALGAAVLLTLAARERATIRGARRQLLAGVLPLFEEADLTLGGDGFPVLRGRMGDRDLRLELLPDTMTIRRLPQLWLMVTLTAPRRGSASLGALVRPTGNHTEFYALTQRLPERLASPPGLPGEMMLRGSAGAGPLLAALTPALRDLLADGRVKEVLVTPGAARIVWQAGEGERGNYLLLRQCRFDGAAVRPDALIALVDALDALREAMPAPVSEESR